MLKNSNKSAILSTKSKTLQSLIIWPVYVWSVQKTGPQKSHASVPLNQGSCPICYGTQRRFKQLEMKNTPNKVPQD